MSAAMRRRAAPWLVAVAVLAASGCERSPALMEARDRSFARGGAAGTIRGQYIVVLDDAADPEAEAGRATRAHGGRVLHVYRHAIRGFAAVLPPGAAAALRRNPRVRLVEADVMDYPGEDAPAAFDDDAAGFADSTAEWGLDRIDQRDLPLDRTYAHAWSGRGVNVYVIDSGIRFTHDELRGRAFAAADFVGDGRAGADCNGHGTHVAAIAGGRTYGVAREARLHSVRVLGCAGGSPRSRTIAAVDWVTANAVQPAVANLSISGLNEAFPAPGALDLAVARATGGGVTFVVAAGNGAADACTLSPAAPGAALVVGASEMDDAAAPYSNFGACVDLFAPGSRIRSASHQGDNRTLSRSGTSMASPHVAGLAALLLERRPGARPAEVAALIAENATGAAGGAARRLRQPAAELAGSRAGRRPPRERGEPGQPGEPRVPTGGGAERRRGGCVADRARNPDAG